MTQPIDPGQGPDFEPPPPTENGVQQSAGPALAPAPTAPTVSAPTGRRRAAAEPAGVGAIPVKNPPGRPKGKAGDVPEPFDPQAPGAPKWSSHEYDILWPELIEWLQAKGRSAYDVTVNVLIVTPPPRHMIGDGFEANAATGDGQGITPDNALKRIIEDYYHLPVCRTPAKYELQFVWRANGQYIVTGYIECASPSEIIALRNAQIQRRLNMPQQQPGLGAPVPQFQQQQQIPAYQQPFVPGYQQPFVPGYFQQQQPQVMDPSIERRFAALEEENRRLRMQIAAPVPRPGLAAPPPPPVQQPITEQSLANAMTLALRSVGLGAGGPQDNMISGMRTALAVMKEFRTFADEASGIFEPEAPERQVPELPAPAEVSDSPYDITEFPSTWDDGSKPKLARNKETGEVDVVATAFLNPRPAQRIINAGAVLMERFGQGRGGSGLGDVPEMHPVETQQQPYQPQFTPPAEQQQLPAAQTPQSPGAGWGNF